MLQKNLYMLTAKQGNKIQLELFRMGQITRTGGERQEVGWSEVRRKDSDHKKANTKMTGTMKTDRLDKMVF